METLNKMTFKAIFHLLDCASIEEAKNKLWRLLGTFSNPLLSLYILLWFKCSFSKAL